MFDVYLFSTLVGGFFVAAAAFSGGDDMDHDHDFDADHDFDVDHEFDADHDVGLALDAGPSEGIAGLLEAGLEVDMDTDLADLPSEPLGIEHALELADGQDLDPPELAGDAAWVPLLSFRFWTYALCFFGLTGGLLTQLSPAHPTVVLALALFMGSTCGYTASWTLRRLRKVQGAETIGHTHYRGSVGKVLIPVGAGKTGKVRCTIRGQDHDLLATSDEAGVLTKGTEVLVLDFDGESADVVHAARLMGRRRGGD